MLFDVYIMLNFTRLIKGNQLTWEFTGSTLFHEQIILKNNINIHNTMEYNGEQPILQQNMAQKIVLVNIPFKFYQFQHFNYKYVYTFRKKITIGN